MRTKSKVGDSVRIHTIAMSQYKKGRIVYDGVIHEICKEKKGLINGPFRNGYIVLSGKYKAMYNGKWIFSTKRKIGLDYIFRITQRQSKVEAQWN